MRTHRNLRRHVHADRRSQAHAPTHMLSGTCTHSYLHTRAHAPNTHAHDFRHAHAHAHTLAWYHEPCPPDQAHPLCVTLPVALACTNSCSPTRTHLQDTPGYGDDLDVSRSISQLTTYIEDQNLKVSGAQQPSSSSRPTSRTRTLRCMVPSSTKVAAASPAL